MKEHEMEKGLVVIISTNPSNTIRTHDINVSMKTMFGKQYTIERIEKSSHGLAAIIEGWMWHYDDLEERLAPEKKAQIFHFDVERLVI